MKTAVSIPDDLFRRAESTARRRRVSRSELYATALAEFLAREQHQAVTDRLNEVYSRNSSELDRGLVRSQAEVLDKEDW